MRKKRGGRARAISKRSPNSLFSSKTFLFSALLIIVIGTVLIFAYKPLKETYGKAITTTGLTNIQLVSVQSDSATIIVNGEEKEVFKGENYVIGDPKVAVHVKDVTVEDSSSGAGNIQLVVYETEADVTMPSPDATIFFTNDKKLRYGSSLSSIKDILTSQDLPEILSTKKVSGDDGVEYDIQLGIATPVENIISFGKNVLDIDSPVLFYDWTTSDGSYTETINFPTAVDLLLLANKDIELFGKKFTVGTTSEQSSTKLTLYASGTDVSVDKRTPTTIGTNTFEVVGINANLAAISEGAATLRINGETMEVAKGQTYALGNPQVIVYIKDVFVYDAQAGLGGVRLFVGSEKVVLESGNAVTKGTANTVVDGTSVLFTSDGAGKVSRISITVTPSKFSTEIKGTKIGDSFTDPVFGTFKWYFHSFSPALDDASREEIVLTATNTDLNLEAPLTTGQFSANVLRGNDTPTNGNEMYLAYSSSKRIWTESGVPIPKGDYFILNDGKDKSRFLKFSGISNTPGSEKVTIEDMTTGALAEWSHTEGTAGSTMTYDGVQYAFTVTPSGTSDGFLIITSSATDGGTAGIANFLFTAKGAKITLPTSTAGAVTNNIIVTEKTAYMEGTNPDDYGMISIPVTYTENQNGNDVALGNPTYSAEAGAEWSGLIVKGDGASYPAQAVTPYGTFVETEGDTYSRTKATLKYSGRQSIAKFYVMATEGKIQEVEDNKLSLVKIDPDYTEISEDATTIQVNNEIKGVAKGKTYTLGIPQIAVYVEDITISDSEELEGAAKLKVYTNREEMIVATAEVAMPPPVPPPDDPRSLAPGDITNCGVITRPGTYTLKQDISNIRDDTTCFSIEASDVVLDGNGHNITGPGLAGVSVSGNNITVQNFGRIAEFSKGVEINDLSNNAIIKNNTITFTGQYYNVGIRLQGVTDQVFIQDNVINVSGYSIGVSLESGSGMTNIGNNTISAYYGIELYYYSGAQIISNKIAGKTSYGIYVSGNSSDNVFQENNINSDAFGMLFSLGDEGKNNKIKSNIVQSTYNAISVYRGQNTVLQDNYFTGDNQGGSVPIVSLGNTRNTTFLGVNNMAGKGSALSVSGYETDSEGILIGYNVLFEGKIFLNGKPIKYLYTPNKTVNISTEGYTINGEGVVLFDQDGQEIVELYVAGADRVNIRDANMSKKAVKVYAAKNVDIINTKMQSQSAYILLELQNINTAFMRNNSIEISQSDIEQGIGAFITAENLYFGDNTIRSLRKGSTGLIVISGNVDITNNNFIMEENMSSGMLVFASGGSGSQNFGIKMNNITILGDGYEVYKNGLRWYYNDYAMVLYGTYYYEKVPEQWNASSNIISLKGSNTAGIMAYGLADSVFSNNKIVGEGNNNTGVSIQIADSVRTEYNSIEARTQEFVGFAASGIKNLQSFHDVISVPEGAASAVFLPGYNAATTADFTNVKFNDGAINVSDEVATVYNYSSGEIIGFENNVLKVKSRADIKIMSGEIPLKNTQVVITDLAGAPITVQTDDDGRVPVQVFTEFIQNGSQRTYYTPHTISFDTDGQTKSLILNISEWKYGKYIIDYSQEPASITRASKRYDTNEKEIKIATNLKKLEKRKIDTETEMALEITSREEIEKAKISIVVHEGNTKNVAPPQMTDFKTIDVTVEDVVNNNIETARIILKYSDEEIKKLNIDENTLSVWKWDDTAGSWMSLQNSGVDTSANFVWANVANFSTYGVFGNKSAEAPIVAVTPPSGGGDTGGGGSSGGGGSGGGGGGSGGSSGGSRTIVKQPSVSSTMPLSVQKILNNTLPIEKPIIKVEAPAPAPEQKNAEKQTTREVKWSYYLIAIVLIIAILSTVAILWRNKNSK